MGKKSVDTGEDYQKILDALNRAANGDLTTEIVLKTEDPNLNAIVKGFNTMVRSLKTFVNEMRDEKRHQEEMVKKFKKIFDNCRDVILFINKYGTIVEINRSVKDILGYEPDDLKGKHFAKTGLIIASEIPALLEGFKTAVEKGKVRDTTNFTCVSKGGKRLNMEAKIGLLKSGDEVEGIVVALRDVTKHIQKDIELKEEKEKLKSILSSIEDLVLIVDKELRLIEYYESAVHPESFVFISLDGYAGQPVKNIFPRTIASEMEKVIQYCMKKREIQQIDYPYTAQKKTVWFNTRVAPIENARGDVTGAAIMIRDVTPQVEMEKILEQTEEKYRKIFEQSPQGLFILDAEGRIVDVNKKMCEWLGYKRSEMIGKDHIMYPFLTKSGKIIAMRKFIQRLSGKFVPPYELEFIGRDGTVYIGEIDARPIKDENGNISLIVVMVTDVTKRK
ncbi:MAG: PAS domain S-box protein [candidate division WOR-3 bacterium]|nr:PAS domain S-box protein [candidate division WOR-3 bacterium]